MSYKPTALCKERELRKKAEQERDEARERERVAIASWDEERQRALKEGECVLEARRERDEARKESLEQAMLLGISGESECRLIAKLDEAQKDIQDVQTRHNQTILEKDHWRNCAEQKIALRRELESLLEIDSKAPSDEQFQAGLNKLKSTIHERDVWRDLAEQLYNYVETPPYGIDAAIDRMDLMESYKRIQKIYPLKSTTTGDR